MILTATPYRVSLFGGGSDYPEYYEDDARPRGGFCVGFAIQHYCYVALKTLPPVYGDINYRIVYAKVEDRKRIEDIEHPAVRGALLHVDCSKVKLELAHMGDLPARAGLGASSAFVVGMLAALYVHRSTLTAEQVISRREELANEAIFVEQRVIKEAVGGQDQILTAAGGINAITFRKRQPPQVTRVWVSDRRRRDLEASLFLIYTGNMRNAHEMAAKQMANLGASESHRMVVDRMVELAREGQFVLEHDEVGIDRLGDMLHQSWMLKRELCAGLTSPEINELYNRLRTAGASGGKLLGAGGGGFLLVYVPQGRQEYFFNKITEPCIRIRISEKGVHVVPTPGEQS